MIPPPIGLAPNVGLRGLVLTPDSSQLVVADFGAQNVYLLDPAKRTGTTVAVGGVPGFTNSGPARVAATSMQTVFVGMSGENGSTGACSSCLAQMNLTASPPTIQIAPQPEVTSLTGAPLVQGTASGDHVFVAFDSSPGGPVAVWSANAPNQFITSPANASTTDLGAASDGTMFAVRTQGGTEIRDANLSHTSVPTSAELAQIPGRQLVPGVALHPTGALIYQPFLTGAPASAESKEASIFSTRIRSLFTCAFFCRNNSSPMSTAFTAIFWPSTKMASVFSPSLPPMARPSMLL